VYAEERRQAILDRARRDGRIEVATIATDLAVAAETIRRDLTDLEARGVLRRVHGGAIPVERFRSEPAVSERAGLMTAEKRRIAQAALEYVPPRGTVLLDAGTTTGELAGLLPDRELTVITNALPIATSLAARGQITVLVVGGRLRGRTLANVDGWALRALADLRADVGFVATNGITAARGLTTPDPAEAEVKAALIAASREVVLLTDSTKVGEEHLVRYATVDEVDVVITDRGLDDDGADLLASAGPRVVRV
jgi:DeoR family transcriptional regulator, fructose operon transcriptional repressor